MIHITPQGTFPIVRQLYDPADTTTYYVRAVIRDSVKGTTLETVDLVDKTGQRFVYKYPAPSDPSGLGRYIDITTTVYSDSGYTTRTDVYADENETYLIKSEQNLGGGGGGETVSYPEIRKIFKQELAKLDIPEPAKQDNLRPVLNTMETRLRNVIIQSVPKIPEQVKPNLDVVVSEIRASLDDVVNTLLIAVDNKEVTPETDLTPVMEMIQALPIEQLALATQQTGEMLNTLRDVVETQEEMDSLRTAAETFTNSVTKKKLPEKKEVEQVNPNQLRAQRLLGNPQIA